MLTGTLSRYKARLVVNGSSQQLGVYFDETFSLIVKPATIRMALSLVLSRKWPIHQLDVKNSFLNGDLSEIVYMHQPPGFVDARFPNQFFVCRDLYMDSNKHLVLGFSVLQVMPHELDFITVVAILLYLFIDKDLSSADFPLYARSAKATFSCSQAYLAICLRDFGFRPSLICLLHYLSSYYTDTDWACCSSTHMCTSETAWLHNLLHELNSPLSTATLVYCDNVSAVYIVLRVPSRFQYSDIFTKGLPSALFEEFQTGLSVRPPLGPTVRAC
uniref:Ribonuclease H-like domain-containing protein n=1 Tax=Tanacetum cinerariifolium TaxID=118510 RepID=A0A6L2NDS5_TANCI|nr:ribonuclease H-like domain-containing protein [Tanacetum cinerariifolium]